jgi:glycosyltransferase involved in cell wall biosynthesis
MAGTVIVIPCFDEEHRLRSQVFLDFVKSHPEIDFALVNDGSRDGTLALLETLAQRSRGRFRVIDQQPNAGKAEAVRRGMRAAFDSGAVYAGFWDADLATPLEAIPEFVALLDAHQELDIVFGARVKLLGRSVDRDPFRHYVGRVFATAVSLVLRMPVYDTQCGAKLFRVTPELREVFAEPFASRWIFDVEILARLMALRRARSTPPLEATLYELPLREWRDVAGSKLKLGDFPRAALELARIYRRYLSDSR